MSAPAESYEDIKADAMRIAGGRVSPTSERHRYASVLGETAFARAFGLDPGEIRTSANGVLFRLAGFTCRVVATMAGERCAWVPASIADERTLVIVATHYPATAAATLAGWTDHHGIVSCELIEHVGESVVRLPVGTLWRMDDLLSSMERKAAEEYALTLLIDRRRTADGHNLDIYWWTDKKSAAISIDGKTVDYIYCVERFGVESWRCVSDDGGYVFKSWQSARDFAIDSATREHAPIPTTSSYTQHGLVVS